MITASKAEILKETREKFAQIKKELGFRSNFEEINEIFSIEDSVMMSGFVSENFERQMNGRIVDYFNSWLGYLQGLMYPNPGSIIGLSEAKILGEEDKSEVGKILSNIMAHVSSNTLNNLTKDKVARAKFIDDSVVVYNRFKPIGIKIIGKINEGWKK